MVASMIKQKLIKIEQHTFVCVLRTISLALNDEHEMGTFRYCTCMFAMNKLTDSLATNSTATVVLFSRRQLTTIIIIRDAVQPNGTYRPPTVAIILTIFRNGRHRHRQTQSDDIHDSITHTHTHTIWWNSIRWHIFLLFADYRCGNVYYDRMDSGRAGLWGMGANT